jgi:hypothetical protein
VAEYRQSYLATGAASVRIGESYGTAANFGSGSSIIKVDTGSANSSIGVWDSGQGIDGPAVRLLQNNASATLTVYGGQVGLAWDNPAETGQIATASAFGGQLYIGAGVTLANLKSFAGQHATKALPGTLLEVEKGSTVTVANTSTGTVTTLQQRGTLIPAGVAFAVTNYSG